MLQVLGNQIPFLQKKEFTVSDLFWLSDRQLSSIEQYVPLLHGVPGVDDYHVLSGIIHVIKHVFHQELEVYPINNHYERLIT